MKRLACWGFAAIFSAATFCVLPSAGESAPPLFGALKGDQDDAEVKWVDNLQVARKNAIAQNKPILIVFGAEWCGYCKKLEKQTLGAPEVASFINDSFVPVHLDLDKERRVGEILEVTSLPCTIVLSSDAELLGRIEGYHTAAPFKQQLSTARQQFLQVQATAPAEKATR